MNRLPDAASIQTRTMFAYAKINLVLRVLAREESGFHGIETMFQRLALHDKVEVTVSGDERTLQCAGATLPATGLGPTENNLAWRAAELYSKITGWDCGWNIVIHKQIPVGGGLGGGSSDAATVLLAMNSMYHTPLGTSELVAMSASLGSDVPFFVSDESRVFAWARGDRMLVLPQLASMSVMLVLPGVSVNTGKAYAALVDARASASGDESDSNSSSILPGVPGYLYRSADIESWRGISKMAQNDFETVVPGMEPAVDVALQMVRGEAARRRDRGELAIALMCGSGSSCFLLSAPSSNVKIDCAGAQLLQTRTH